MPEKSGEAWVVRSRLFLTKLDVFWSRFDMLGQASNSFVAALHMFGRAFAGARDPALFRFAVTENPCCVRLRPHMTQGHIGLALGLLH